MVVKLPDTCACIAATVPYPWSNVTVCPNCRKELRVMVQSHDCGKLPRSPVTCTTSPIITPPCGVPFISWQHSSPLTVLNIYNDELKRLADTVQALRLSGWYYSGLDWQGARNLLKDTSPGAFIIRDSGDRNFIFSLSVQTERGPTSVRLHYETGYFRLDCANSLAKYMARFQCVVELVQHYASTGGQASAGTVWVDREGCPHSPVLLKNPKRKTTPSLLHLSRLAIHKALDSPLKPKLKSAPKHRVLPLPKALFDYLGEYPYWI